MCWLAFEVVFCWLFVVETKNRTLEETAALFDGEGAVDQITEKAAAHDEGQDASEKRSTGQADA